jgi:putative protein kinase ArgK-like GTPase of G3E family
MQKDLEYVLHLRETDLSWQPKVFQTVANQAKGTEDLWKEIKKHQVLLKSENLLLLKRELRLKNRVEAIIRQKMEHHFWDEKRKHILHNYLKNERDKLSPYTLAERMLEKLLETM